MSMHSSAATQFLAAAADKLSDRISFETAPTAASSHAPSLADHDDDEEPADDFDYHNGWVPLNHNGWVPLNKNGTQRNPNQIRGELQRYLDKYGQTQASVLMRMGVSGHSLRKFMDPKNYKNMWSAVQNETYWAGAKLLEEERTKPKAAASRKRKANDTTESSVPKKSKTQAKTEAIELMQRIMAVTGTNQAVYDSGPEVVKKIKAFLEVEGVTKSDFCNIALGGLQAVQLNKFLLAKHQDGAGMSAYQRAWSFFEKKRVWMALRSPRLASRMRRSARLAFRSTSPAHACGLRVRKIVQVTHFKSFIASLLRILLASVG